MTDKLYAEEVFAEEQETDSFFDLQDERKRVLEARKIYDPTKEKHWIYDERTKWQRFVDFIKRAEKTGKFSGNTCFIYKEDHDEQEKRNKRIYEYEKDHKITYTGSTFLGPIPTSSMIESLKFKMEEIRKQDEERQRVIREKARAAEEAKPEDLKKILNNLSDKIEKIRRDIGFGRKLNANEIRSIRRTVEAEYNKENSLKKKKLNKLLKKKIRSLDEDNPTQILTTQKIITPV